MALMTGANGLADFRANDATLGGTRAEEDEKLWRDWWKE